MAEPLPTGAAEMIPAAMASVERHLAPVTKETLAVLMQRLWDAGIPQPEPVTIAEWMRLLADYPERALARAFDELARTYRWPSPPKPADVVRHLDAELERAHAWRRLLQRAKVRAELDAAQGRDERARQERHRRWLENHKAQMTPEQLRQHQSTVEALKSGASALDVLAGRV